MTKHILIIKDFFPLIKDPRLIKINLILSTKYKVSLLGWDREFTKRKCLKDEKIPILHLRTIHLGFQRALLFPWWWLFIIYVLIKYNYDAVHVINLPSLLPSILICKIKKKKIIYDIEDSYIDQNELPNIIRTIGLNFEKFLTKFCDGVILVDEIQQKEYGKILSKNIEIVYDSPPDIYYNEQNELNNNIFTFFYAGGLTKGRNLNLEKVIDVVISIPNVKLIIAGTGDLVNYIKNKEINNPNKIKYIGQISYFEVLRYTIDADAIFSIRDNVPPVQKFICGSKFLEAIMAGKPFLVNSNCSAAVKVKKHKCGLIVNPHNKEDFKKMILKLIDDKLLINELGTKGRLAYNKYYSWKVMNTRLLKFYEKILI